MLSGDTFGAAAGTHFGLPLFQLPQLFFHNKPSLYHYLQRGGCFSEPNCNCNYDNQLRVAGRGL
jgi:hypothetical protein